MSLLLPDMGLLFWMLLAFVVVFLVLRKYGFPVIVRMVDERKKLIDDSLREAEDTRKRVERIQQESDAILNEARGKQTAMLREMETLRQQLVEEARQAARQEGQRMMEETKRLVEEQKERAMDEMRQEVAKLAVAVAEKIVRKEVANDSQQMELVDKMLDELTEKEHER